MRKYEPKSWLEISTLKGAPLRRAYARAMKRSSALNAEFIRRGRGHWRNAEVEQAAKEGDALALEELAVSRELYRIRNRATNWHGPGFDWL